MFRSLFGKGLGLIMGRVTKKELSMLRDGITHG